MADQLDPEQIVRASEALEQLINGFSKSKTSEEKRQEAQERFGKSLGKSAADLGSSLYKGEQGAAVFGTAVDSATGSLSMLILALGPFSIAAKVAAIAIAGFGKAVSLAAKQSDTLYKSYQDLSRAGAATAGLRAAPPTPDRRRWPPTAAAGPRSQRWPRPRRQAG